MDDNQPVRPSPTTTDARPVGRDGVYVTASVNELAVAVAGGLSRLRVGAEVLPWTGPLAAVALPPGSVLVVVSGDCRPALCLPMRRGGVEVVVLAALPQEEEGHEFLRCGAAAYLPMDMDLSTLADSIRSLKQRGQRP